MPKRILLINWRDIRNPEAGGAEIYYHEIFRRLAGRGWEITVLSHRFRGAPREETIDGIRVVRRGGKYLFNYEIMPWVARRAAAFDLVVEDLNKLPFFTPLYLAARRLHLVMHFFGASIYRETIFPLASYVFLMEKLVPLFYRGESFVAISNSTRDEITGFGVPVDKVQVVEPGIDIAAYAQAGPKAAVPTIMFIGRLMKYKNVQFVIRALPQIRKTVPDLVFIVAGNGPYLGELRRICRAAGLENAVRFEGMVSEERKRQLLGSAHLLVNPSAKEGWGINNIEANLCGTVSLSADTAGLRDSVRDGVTGLLYRPGDTGDFCNKVRQLLTDSAARKTMETAAGQWARQFSWESIADRMELVIRRHLEKP